MLARNPARRLTAREALQHPWFQEALASGSPQPGAAAASSALPAWV
jgi:hypothetical protein